MTSLVAVIADTLSPNADVRRNGEKKFENILPGLRIDVFDLLTYLLASSSFSLFSLAENQLSEALKQPGHPLEVLRLVADANAAQPPVRQAAAVHFKNLVNKGWDESKDVSHRFRGYSKILCNF